MGLAYDTTPVQDAFRSPRLPDNDRIWLAVGARYQPSPTWWLDFGYTYIWVDDASSELRPVGPVPGTLVGTYKANVQVLAAQVSFKF
jgi:long-chain fatty acid transport protein